MVQLVPEEALATKRAKRLLEPEGGIFVTKGVILIARENQFVLKGNSYLEISPKT